MHTSIVNNQSLRWILVPAATAVAAAKDGTNCDPKPNLICKRSQLPIYVDEPEQKQEVVITEKDDTIDVIADYVGTVRKTIKSAVDEVKAYASVGEDAINQTKENLDGLVDFLRKEENTVPRAGAIAIGALAGLILGLRGRWFKRTIYSTAGGLAMAAVCYPKEAAEYSQVGLDEAKKYVTIGYNFVQGDTQQQVSKPEESKK
ncbi:MICOS complex subunit MIC27 isoform X2 [Aethina tumida]|uniref:MICOS complex subunit MIC27 isoform X2 n=1 Tax=Aethina tumida TaxID=116153 RepID=UPI00214979AD|nr:MICOS complex subunit MIC27 isoform X2 [Aethina tumida]